MATKKTINLNGVLTEVWETAASAQQIDDAVLGNLAATTDCNIDLKAGGNRMLVSRYVNTTLNSPLSEGIVTDGVGMVITYACTANYGRQLCLTGSGGGLCMRHMSGGTVSKWVKITTTDYIVNGTYTGNGSAAVRTIATKGIGKSVAVYSKKGTALIINNGAIVRDGTTVSAINESEVYYANDAGDIALATTSKYLNENGVKYYYQVL